MSSKKSSIIKKNLVDRAIKTIAGFAVLIYHFCRYMSISGKSKGTIGGSSSHVTAIALHFGRSSTLRQAQ